MMHITARRLFHISAWISTVGDYAPSLGFYFISVCRSISAHSFNEIFNSPLGVYRPFFNSTPVLYLLSLILLFFLFSPPRWTRHVAATVFWFYRSPVPVEYFVLAETGLIGKDMARARNSSNARVWRWSQIHPPFNSISNTLITSFDSVRLTLFESRSAISACPSDVPSTYD